VEAANQRLWEDNPELSERQLTMGPEDYEYRREWMAAYQEALAEENPPPPTSGDGNVGDPSSPCPAEVQAELVVTVTRSNDGAPIHGTDVQIDGPEFRNGTTNAAGTATFSGICPGGYTVTGTKANHTTDTTTKTVQPATTDTAELILDAEVDLVVTVIDQSTADPISGATVRISGAEAAQSRTDASGEARFIGIPTGNYQIDATQTGYRAGRAQVSVAVGSTAETLQLAAAGGLAGRVTESAQGLGVGGASVTVDGQPSLSATTDAQGNFDLGEVQAGTYTVRAAKGGVTASQSVTVSGSTSQTVNLVLVWRDEYQPGDPIQMKTEIPWNAALQASAGERIIFNVEYTDKDRRRHGTGPWTDIPGGEGPFELRFVATNGRFDNAASGARRKTIAGLRSGNADLFIDAAWDGRSPVTVTLTVVDLAVAKSAPDNGTTKDPDYVHTWTISSRARAHPTSMACDSGNFGSDQPAPAVYQYIMNPEINPPGRPSYQGQSVLESFHPITANFAMNDLTDVFRAAHPALTTPDQAARFMNPGSNNGTFVINGTDHIADRHGGFALPTGSFKPAVLTSGIGFTLPQDYSCAGTVIGSYTIRRTYKGGNISVNKSGP
jgi:hypothetical protein